MIDGEATQHEVASPPSDRKSDGVYFFDSPVSSLSRYSSCGESEFERYCSANSVMGTPSLCSSIGTYNDCLDSEFASFRSLDLVDDSFDSFSLGGGNQKVLPSSNDSCVGERRVGIIRGNVGLKLYQNDKDIKTMADSRNGNVSEGISIEEVGKGVLFNNDDGSSRYGCGTNDDEHSEDEDSMYGGGSDDEQKGNVYFRRTEALYHVQEAKARDENPFVINSSVAFGSKDWDDFELETEGGALDSMNWVDIQEQTNNLKPDTSLVPPTYHPTLIEISRAGQVDVSKARKHVLDTNHSPDFYDSDEPRQVTEEPVIAVGSYQLQGTDELLETTRMSSEPSTSFPKSCDPERVVKDNMVTNENVRHSEGGTTMCLYDDSVDGVFEMGLDPLAEDLLQIDVKIEDYGKDRKHQIVDNVKLTSADGTHVSEIQELRNSRAKLDPLSDITMNPLSSCPIGPLENSNADVLNAHMPNSSPSTYESDVRGTLNNNLASADLSEDNSPLVKAQNLDLNDFYDDVVLEMEEILLDSSDTPGSRFPQSNRAFQSQISPPMRDGGSPTSTSGIDDRYPTVSHPLRIDGVEVIGAKQRKGDVSLSERLVGVKEYTVYRIRVYSGNDHWEVERRYRDFYTFYRRLRSLYADQGWILASPWLSVEKESRKIFGNVSPDVVSERSALIQKCLCSVLESRVPSSPPSAVIWFLSNQDSFPSSPASNVLVSGSTSITRGQEAENISTLGKTISLIVEIQPYKSTKQMLEAQHYTCAGCHKHFDDGMTVMQDFLQTLGWGKPRLCEYTSQLCCYSCHTNETAVLPARVLHHWDFTPYPVSQFAKSYLDSIHDQPMLCVSAVNPVLFSKVPALQYIMSIRKKLGTMLPYIRCPFRRSINSGLGSRKYLLESNDFFALRDLIDLSKGPFAALPTMVETVSRKILEHITDQCLVCCDVGVACGARQACNDPSSLIFPFQEDETEKCRSCASLFHKACFQNITSCPCGARLRAEDNMNSGVHEASSTLSFLAGRRGSGFTAGLLSGLFLTAKPENTNEHKDSDNVILMGSLPGTSL